MGGTSLLVPEGGGGGEGGSGGGGGDDGIGALNKSLAKKKSLIQQYLE